MLFFSSLQKISKTAYIVAFITLLARAGQFMSMPFLAIYLAHDGILTSGQIGLVLGIAGFMLSATSLFNGMFIDRSSHKNTLIIALFLSGVCYFSFAFSTHVFYELFLLNAALGWFRSLVDLSSITFLMLNTKPEYLSHAYSLRFISANLGVAIGPLIGALMSTHQSFFMFYIAGGIHIFIAIAMIFYRETLHDAKPLQRKAPLWEDFRVLMKDKVLIAITLINLLIWCVYAQLDTTIPQHLATSWKNPAVTFSILMTINALICVFFQPIILRWAELTSLKISGIIGGVMFAISFLLLSLHPTLPLMIIAIIIMSFAELFTLPVNGMLVMRTAPQHLVASYNGFSNIGLFGLSLGPILGGFGLQWIGGEYVFLIDGILPIIVVWLYLKYIPD